MNRDISRNAASTASSGCIAREPSGRRSWRSRFIPISAASRTGSNISKGSTSTSIATTACCTGTGSRSSIGTCRPRRRRDYQRGVMLPSERLDFSAINQRPKLALPDGARLAVWVIVNVEEWDPTQPMPRAVLTPPAGGAPMPDIPNWAWHEYGNRVGFWRMLEVFDRSRIRAVLAINGSAIQRYKPIAHAALERGWEFIGHGFSQRSMQKVADERDDIRRTAAAIRDFTGRPPRGWLGPGLTETWETPDLLVEEGFEYVCDWVLDDQPVWLKTRTKSIVNLPYTQECNDVAMMLIQHHNASEYYDRAIDQFEQLY